MRVKDVKICCIGLLQFCRDMFICSPVTDKHEITKILPSDCNFCKSEDGNSITLNLKPEDRDICAKNARPASYINLPIICNLQVSSFLSPEAGEKQKKLWMSRILQKKLSRKGRCSTAHAYADGGLPCHLVWPTVNYRPRQSFVGAICAQMRS